MAIRYLADFGSPQKPDFRHFVPADAVFDFVSLGDRDGVGIAGPRIVLPDDRGVIIGHLFANDGSHARITSLDANATNAIIQSGGETLIADCWGGYVACLSTPDRDGWHVVRDPSGTLPCYFMEARGRILVTSDIALLCERLEKSPSVDWTAMARHLQTPDLRRPETCLEGVREVLAGDRLTWTAQHTRTTSVWSPWRFADLTAQPDTGYVEKIRASANGCIDAWGRCFDRIGLSLSGGLDSSIVAAGLRHQTTGLTFINMATDEAEGDERTYARAVADRLGCDLTERFYELTDVNVAQAASAHLPRPIFSSLTQAEIAIKRRLEAEAGLDVFFAGHGGDNVFCHIRSATPALDRFHREGLSPGVFSTMDDICELTGCSVVEVISQVAPRLLQKRSGYHWTPDGQFLSSDMVNSSPMADHPWLQAPRDVLPGKAVHVAMLTRIQSTIDGFSRDLAGQINPLLSQPLVEACLGVPTWKWIEGGIDRAVARRAFAAVLPDRVIQRRSKGGPGRFAFQIAESNRDAIRDQLVNGVLARNGLLSVPSLQAAFDAPGPIDTRLYVRLLFLAEAETWACHWSTR